MRGVWRNIRIAIVERIVEREGRWVLRADRDCGRGVSRSRREVVRFAVQGTTQPGTEPLVLQLKVGPLLRICGPPLASKSLRQKPSVAGPNHLIRCQNVDAATSPLVPELQSHRHRTLKTRIVDPLPSSESIPSQPPSCLTRRMLPSPSNS